MDEQPQIPRENHMTPARRRRNRLIGGVLALAALGMYISIFIRLSISPLE